jgi:hypothetical protein|tara:strand:+ start:497 stop:2362 length:1866 start_codon:yes stop_codon:yes gene_type:complete
MPLAKYTFKPGINREGTNYSNEGGWFNSDKVRFRKGKPERIAGWEKNSLNSFKGTARSLYSYRDTDSTSYVGVGTHLKYFVKEGSTFYNITPIRKTSTNSITFAATDGSSVIVVTDSSHGAVANDSITFSSAVTLGGNITADVLNQEYQVDRILSSNTYEITAKDTSGSTVTANSSDTGNGGSGVDGSYEINVGLDVFVKGTGWGAGTWSAGTWGSTTAISAVGQLRLWSQDNFGDDLIGNIRGGGIFYWDESSGVTSRAVALSSLGGASDTPIEALQVMVSDIDKHVICFGSNPIGSSTLNPLFVRWSDTESASDWTPTATNQAGGIQLSQGSLIVGALQTRQEILIWTDVGITSMRFVGEPFIFSFIEVATGPSLISPNAAVNANNRVYFMDRGGFYVYSGSAQRLPCTVLDYIYSDLNLNQAYKCFAASIENKNEVIWFYPSLESLEVDRYVIYNYLEDTWVIGTTDDGFTRTAWIEAPTLDFPVAAGKTSGSDTNFLFNHELGHSNDGSDFTAFIESSDFDLSPDGERLIFISKLIPDVEFRDQYSTGDTVTYTIKGRNYPLESLSTLQTINVTPESTFINARTRSRHAAIRISNTGSRYGWRTGDLRLEIRGDGKR